jgi:hypothetical protein
MGCKASKVSAVVIVTNNNEYDHHIGRVYHGGEYDEYNEISELLDLTSSTDFFSVCSSTCISTDENENENNNYDSARKRSKYDEIFDKTETTSTSTSKQQLN